MRLQRKLNLYSSSLALTVGLLITLAISFVVYARTEKAIDRANDLRQLSFLLADELRQSSDDLTRMARTYVITGNPIYEKHYRDILAIRDGKKNRPEQYHNIYWDLVLEDGRAPRPDSPQAIPLLDRMRQAGFTEQEFSKLAEAKANSDALTAIEIAAMKMTKAAGTEQVGMRTKAIAMLHDENYHRLKAGIMKPIDDFYVMMDKRTHDSVHVAELRALVFRVVFIAFGLSLMFTLWRTYTSLRDILGGSVDEVYANISRIGSGDFSADIPVTKRTESSVLAWLSNMQAGLKDIELHRKQTEAEIYNIAFYDHLTNLPNRRLLLDRLQQTIALSARHHKHGAILFIDIDNFKSLNDTRGHDVGDLLLVEITQRLRDCVREGDTVARLGGDEFVILLEDLSESAEHAAAEAEAIGEKVLEAVRKPYMLRGREHHSTASIGVSMFLKHELTVDELLRRADTAMYQAKAAGRNVLRFYDPAMQDALEARAAIESGMRRALPLNQFRLYYQAQVHKDGQVHGFEALLRWEHPERGLVSPAEFIPLAEENGLILQIGLWVLQTACRQLKSWETDAETRHLVLAVNVSARQFRQADFVDQILRVVRETKINPAKLKLELTESLVLSNIDDTSVKMQALKRIGVRFSMDDFGTGYSSLVYLTKLPFDQVKIDQSFVRNISSRPSDAVIVQTIIGMARNLGLGVVAEGVETEEQRSFLERHGCTNYQGFLFGKPAPAEDIGHALKAQACPKPD